MRLTRIDRRNATFQQWQTLLTNRTKRSRAGAFIVQGVRPISLAVQHDWEIQSWLAQTGRRSEWAASMMRERPAQTYELSPDLMAELSEKEDGAELLAVVTMPPDRLDRIAPHMGGPVLVFDRPSTPGNIGTLIRSIDALGGSGLIITGHAADPYDPKAVRASTGSFFTVPVVRCDATATVLDWARQLDLSVLGTDESGDTPLPETDLTGRTLIVIGNETRGMARAWHEACDQVLTIPMVGSASSLNAASAGTVALYEASRQR
ncbi:TrmH family RNA methyltransferase [Demetria terragena]|uniref:TrmH family RNA methyltransferase n=1 Tax=Demetria terragena TaxID=63959 RepID=UPI0003670010|nr:TrmH family RNA methyltransferase [Demetria terragena]